MLEESDFSLFVEPSGYFKPEAEPSKHAFKRSGNVNGPKEINFELIGNHSLWAHVVWNAGKFIANYFDANADIVKDKSVLELGAGAAIPSIVAVLDGASNVVATDYPEREIIDILQQNIKGNVPCDYQSKIHALGYLWGSDTRELIDLNGGHKYDIIIMSDLLFNHSEHEKMMKTCTSVLSPDGSVIVAYSHHRPHLAHKDLDFFEVANRHGMEVAHESIHKMGVMFEEDPGDVYLRENVFMKVLKFKRN
jgi:nicotinamide N-methyltransferase